MTDPYQIQRDPDQIVIRLRPGLVSDDALDRLLDLLRVRELQQQAAVSAEDTDALAREVKRAVGERWHAPP